MKSRTERIETIKSRVEAHTERDGSYTHKLKYRDSANILPVIKLETEYLGFRLENSRTLRQQKGYLRENPTLSKDFFDDPESNKAQKAQEEILFKMVSGHKSFLNDLKKYGQDEPAIITFDGFLVNGNRRTSALKHLGVEYVDCAVLPKDVNAKEIYQIEQDLQIAEDFKQDYDWINELLNIRSGKNNIKYKLTDAQLAKNLRISPQALRSKLIRIDLVDSFLGWKNMPDHYDYPKLDDAEQVFKELEKGMKKYADDIEKQTSLKDHIFSIVENRPKRGRVYEHVTDIIKNFDDILAKLNHEVKGGGDEDDAEESTSIEEILTDTEEAEYETKETADGGKTSTVVDIPEPTPTVPVKPEESKKLAEKLIEAKDDVKAEKKEEKSQEAVYHAISDALRSLSKIKVQRDSTKLYDSKKKLTELLTKAVSLMEAINDKLDEV